MDALCARHKSLPNYIRRTESSLRRDVRCFLPTRAGTFFKTVQALRKITITTREVNNTIFVLPILSYLGQKNEKNYY